MSGYQDMASTESALDYPYSAPPNSYVLIAGCCHALPGAGPSSLDEALSRIALMPEVLDECLEGRTLSAQGRTPVLAYGSNRSPRVLAKKLQGCRDGVVPVLSAVVSGLDVCYSAHVARNGILPATIYPYEDTAVRVKVTWFSSEQLARIHESESLGTNYDFMRISGIEVIFEDGSSWQELWAYVSRRGCLNLGLGPVALSAIEASGRRAVALSEREVMRELAVRFSDTSDANEFVARLAADEALRASLTLALTAGAVHGWPGHPEE